jgi:hypothetical protein
MLFGLFWAQAYSYFQSYPADRSLLKAAVSKFHMVDLFLFITHSYI